MVMSFKQQFKEPILSNVKIHSIREDKPTDGKPERLSTYMATGVRTKNYNCFKVSRCVSIQKIEIIRTSDYLNETIVKIDGRSLSEKEVMKLARNDGFKNPISFRLWFNENFEGKIIHWTNFKY
jgi:hypothetical protein